MKLIHISLSRDKKELKFFFSPWLGIFIPFRHCNLGNSSGMQKRSKKIKVFRLQSRNFNRIFCLINQILKKEKQRKNKPLAQMAFYIHNIYMFSNSVFPMGVIGILNMNKIIKNKSGKTNLFPLSLFCLHQMLGILAYIQVQNILHLKLLQLNYFFLFINHRMDMHLNIIWHRQEHFLISSITFQLICYLTACQF